MEFVQLRFRSIGELWSFKKLIEATSFQIDTSTLTLKCMCSDEQIENSKTNFSAEVVSAFAPGIFSVLL